MQEQIRDLLEYSSQVLARCAADNSEKIAAAARMIYASVRAGGTVAFCGNGGSASQAQHLAAEFVGRFLIDRPAYSAIALTTDTSILTAVGNDYGFDQVFARQVEGLLKPMDVLVALSTSGNSPNCILACEKARQLGVKTIGISGCGGGKLAEVADHCITVSGYDTPQIQEAHLAIGHAICAVVEKALVEAAEGSA